MTDKKLKLTKANEVFINEYLTCFNGTEAYSRAYPKANRNSARANASNLLANPNIKSEIERRLAEVHMSADEALKLVLNIESLYCSSSKAFVSVAATVVAPETA